MESVVRERFAALIAKAVRSGYWSLTLNESRELERLTAIAIGEQEFGYPIYGED